MTARRVDPDFALTELAEAVARLGVYADDPRWLDHIDELPWDDIELIRSNTEALVAWRYEGGMLPALPPPA